MDRVTRIGITYDLALFSKVAAFRPLKPIMGTDDEFVDISGEMGGNDMFQNKRASAIFKDGKDGKPHYLDAIVWQGEDR